MRHSVGLAGSILLLGLCPLAAVKAEPLTINQNAWLNYAIVVNLAGKPSNLQLGQVGTINGISSAQVSGNNDAYLMTHQRGELNGGFIYQSGWNTVTGVVQEGSDWGGNTRHPTKLVWMQTDEGYLSYFTTGGFSFVSLTDPAHTWYSRFGRGR